LENSCKFGWMN